MSGIRRLPVRTSHQRLEGIGASRHCDFPDGVHVEERAIEWNPGESYTLEIFEGTLPFASATGAFSLLDGDGTAVTIAFEYELDADASADPNEIERQNREELLPMTMSGFKHYVETGEPMMMPQIA